MSLPTPSSLLKMPLVATKQQLLPYPFVKQHGVLPLAIDDQTLLLAISDLADLETLEQVRLRLGKEVIEYPAPRQLIEEAIAHCYGSAGPSTAELLRAHATHQDLFAEPQYPVATLWKTIVEEALQQRASDIHLDPLPDHCQIRYRIDGRLTTHHSCPPHLAATLSRQLKVLAKLDIAERRLPQDGHLQLEIGPQTLDLRISTLPVADGERLVLRLLDRSALLLPLADLGMPEQVLTRWQQQIACCEGLLLSAGPTGSGKTTTLYSTLATLASSTRNVMTIEDPIEYQLPGIAQTSIQPHLGLTFATALRHLLRQDPDVVLIGEIRDRETAKIAIQAALTGHLVLTTLHAQDAATALARLLEMGIKPYLLTSALRGVLAQRLIPILCPHCKAAPPHKRGCRRCLFSGFIGRTGIYELLEMNDAIRRHLQMAANAQQLRQLALQAGMQSLSSHGQQLVAMGKTTRQELLRMAIEQ